MKRFRPYKFILVILICTVWFSCRKDPPPIDNPPDPEPSEIIGYSILAKLPGIWNGPVSSSTALGGYAEWIVDFRPISAGQVSAKNELDELNDIFMSFFVARYNEKNQLIFRNGGGFNGQKRVSYFRADSSAEAGGQAYYRFVELIKGKNRAYTEVIFRQDSLILKTYTNKYNQLTEPVYHMGWNAKLQDNVDTQDALNAFQYPKTDPVKDFSTSFSGVDEAVFYSLLSDPYPETEQPHLGQTSVQFTFAQGFAVDNAKKVFIIITTQPLISGFNLNQANMKYRSRYVRIGASAGSFTFNYMHPDTYYVYALYDKDGNNTFSSGDYVSTQNTSFSLASEASSTANVQMNFVIP